MSDTRYGGRGALCIGSFLPSEGGGLLTPLHLQTPVLHIYLKLVYGGDLGARKGLRSSTGFYMFLLEALIASAVIYACTTFGLCFSLGYSSAPA